jgi:hypothetical protein
MRKEVACLAVVGGLVLGTGTAHADPVVLGDWHFDDAAGQVAADSSGFAAHGRLGATTGDDSADPAWIAGHAGGGALDFDGSQFVAVPDSARLETPHVAVDAWVRSDGSPGKFRYVLSKGSVNCDRSAYGLYSGWSGGLSFYVSSTTHYVISPEVPSSVVWDGAWHHVIGSYDGAQVRLSIDGAQVGSGTATSLAVAYGVGSKGVYIGTYRGSCDLGFRGSIDDVRIWSDIPAEATGGPVITPVPGTPTVVSVPTSSGGPSSGTSGTSGTSGSKNATKPVPKGCLRVTLSRRTVPVKRRTVVVATVRRNSKRVAGAHLEVRGGGLVVTGKTNRKGTARIAVKARKRGSLTVRVRGQKSSCPATTVRAR